MIGRESGDIILNDPEASALHAEIEFTKGAVIVRDLGSRNGTFREGQRLPQFALFRGQSFRCGTTDITLVEITDIDVPMAGGTASGKDKVDDAIGQSSSTLPSAAAASQTLPRGVVPTPGEAASTPTLVGPGVPPPGHPPSGIPTVPLGAPIDVPLINDAPSGQVTMPPGRDAPSSPVSMPPVVGAPASSTPTAPGAGPTPAAPAPAAPAAPGPAAPGAPAPVAAAPSAPIAPVANAVIKLGDAQPKRAKQRDPEARAARGRLIKRLLVGTLVVGALAGLVYGIYSLVAGRNQAFLKQMAREMPKDSVGVLAFSSPRDLLDLLGDEVPPEIREEADKELGFDPFTPDSYTGWGLDVDAPLGISLLDGDGMVAVSVGVGDKDELRTALSSKAAELLKADEDLRWIERSFAETPGLWLDEPVAVAVLLPGERAIFVAGGDSEQVARHAKSIAETEKGETLADRPGFKEIANEKGKLLMGMYADGANVRAAIPGKEEAMVARLALADFDGMALLLSDDGPQVHLSVQTILREDAKALTIFESMERKGKILENIPAPVLAEIDGVFIPDQITESFGAGASLGLGFAMAEIEREFREETSLDLRTDILDNLDGQYGFVLQTLPGKREEGEKRKDPGLLFFAGVKDGDAARTTAERFFSKMQRDLDLELEQIEGTTVYVVDDRPRLSYFIHNDVLWGAVGEVDLPQLIKGGDSFVSTARIPAIEKAVRKGGFMSGFVDLRPIFEQIRAGLDEDEQEEMDEWSSLTSPLEAVTLRGEMKSRAFVMRVGLHTSSEHALAELSQAVMKRAGAEFAKDLARERRRQRCQDLIEHILELMRAEIKSPDFESQLSERRFELMEECRKDVTTDEEIDCMLQAKSLDALTRCEDGEGTEPAPSDGDGGSGGQGDGVIPVDVLEQPEPTPVPFIDDIWPHTSPAGTATGRPDEKVNYAVGLGDSPAIRGSEDALITIVMFGDFQCPYCKKVLPTLDTLLAKDREVRLVFRHNPLAMHADAEIAARAAIAAGEQGKFWEMHDKLFDNQHSLNEGNFRIWAAELGLDMTRFDRDYADSAIAARVKADTADAKKFGATGTPAFFVNGRYLQGSQPLHSFEEVITEEKARVEKFVERRGNTRKRLYSDMVGRFAPEVIAPPTTPATPVGEKRYTIDTSGLPRRGSPGFVRVEIVECGDLDCPFCKRATTTLDKVLTDYEGKVALFWLHNPLSFHAGAEPAARAASAAHEQGKFWEMHDKLIADRTKRTDKDFIGYASDLGLDTKQFELDLADTRIKTMVTEQQKVCTDNDASGTPVFYVNGRQMSGAQPYDKFKEVIDQELAGGI